MSPLTQQHRAQQMLLRRAVVAEFTRIWPALRWERLDESYPELAVRVAALVEYRRATSAGLSAEYLRLVRRDAGHRGQPRIRFAEMVPAEQLNASLHSTSVASVKASVGRGLDEETAMGNALGAASGAVVRMVLNGGRETLTATTVDDPAARGWRRVLGGGGCDFCRSRAGVRMTSAEVFEAHGACACTAEPIY